jgi:hypothetical protein
MIFTNNDNQEIDKKLILENTNIGIEFEFIIDSDDISSIIKQISKEINEKVVLYSNDDRLSGAEINYSVYNLTQDYSGGAFCYELVTPKLSYKKTFEVIKKMFAYIEKFGHVNDRCSIHLNMSFENEKAIGLPSGISGLIPLQFVCQFDESKVYELFPERKNNVYASSIKNILPANEFVNINNIHLIDNFIVCNTKYYGVNFLKLEKNYIEFRYIGGKKYTKKFNEIKELTNHFIFSLYNCLKNPGIVENDKIYIIDQMNRFKKIFSAIQSYSKFIENYKKIKILVDLSSNEKIIEFKWNQIKYDIYCFLLNCKKFEGIINLDTETQRIQIKNAKLFNVNKIKNCDFIDCEIEKFLSIENNDVGINFYNCKISESILEYIKFINCQVYNSKTKDCYSNRLCEFENCYIKNSKNFSGSFKKCYFVSNEPNEDSFLEDCYYIEKNINAYKNKIEKQMKLKQNNILKKNKLRI